MPFVIKGELRGVQEAVAALSGFTRTRRNKVLRNALRKPTTAMKKDAKALAPKETKTLAVSLNAKLFSHAAGVTGVVGPKPGSARQVTIKKDRVFRQSGGRRGDPARGIKGVFGKTVRIKEPPPEMLTMKRNPVKYAHLAEFGTKYRDAFPFLMPAFDKNEAAATNHLIRTVTEEIERLFEGK